MDKEWVGETISQYEQFLNPSLARLFRYLGLDKVECSASGCFVTDHQGKRYIDCLGGYGVFSLGHRHPAVVSAVKKQLDVMPLSSKVFFSRSLGEAAALLAEVMPGNLQYSFFCNSGAEAVEGALKLARLATGRSTFIAAHNAFHGKSFGALSATGRAIFRDPFKPLLKEFIHVPFGDALAIEEALDDSVAAVILEPIQGEGGIIVPPDDYLLAVSNLCRQKGVLLICDEVQTGLGRTGEWFAVNHYKVEPDILTTAKALGGGVMPVAAFTATPQVWQPYVEHPLLHTSTFGGNPLAATAALAAISVIKEENLCQQSKEKGEFLLAQLRALQEQYPDLIYDVRGRGLMIGVEFFQEGQGGALMAALLARGVLAAYTLNNPKVLRLEPPLIISYELLAQVIEIFYDSLAEVRGILQDLS
ncbi:MAG: aminotransferase class III-fold pyridoxal phosphate-dependent enzyme [Sporomusaceae bacterium]|nr:aminotransferase class III-fold pyridoxal phosphate-dependent enzyme [Sporomusaceae bacterium]